MKWLLVVAMIWGAWVMLRPKRRALPRADEADARAVLGVARDADADTIRAAHRRLIADVHPDRGGSVEDTRRVNAARDLLLRAAKRRPA